MIRLVDLRPFQEKHEMHPRYAPILFALLLSGVMSFVVSGIATFRATGAIKAICHDY